VRLMIVEDDDSVIAALRAALIRHGFQVLSARTGQDAIRLIADGPDVVLLDLGLPDRDGIALCQHIRRLSAVPIIVVTARGDVSSRIHGLQAGADDYLVKPYHLGELIARIQAVIRRTRGAVSGSAAGDAEVGLLRCGTVAIDPSARRVTVAGAPVSLARKEFDLLVLLAQEPGVVFRRDYLITEVWHTPSPGMDRTLEVHMASLRRKLDVPGLIETVRGVGYRLAVQIDAGQGLAPSSGT
jgi:DNA-binding response OmpR family regulator